MCIDRTVIHAILLQFPDALPKVCRISALIAYCCGTKLALLYIESATSCCRRSTNGLAQGLVIRSAMRNDNPLNHPLTKVLFIGAVGLAFSGKPTRAQGYLSGTYKCVSVEVERKTRPCSAPSLELNSDGSYEMLAVRGTYEILKGHWLILSAAKNHRRARLDGSQEIIFEFVSGGKKSKITYRRKYQRPPAWVSG